MKNLVILGVVFLFCNLLPQNVVVNDYEVAISKAKSLRFEGSWNWGQNGTAVTSNSAKGSLAFRTFYSSLPTAWFINVDGNGGKNYSEFNHFIRVNALFRKYVWENEKFFASSELNLAHANTYQQIESNLTVGFGYGRYINATPLAKAVRIENHLINDKLISNYLPKETMISIANIIEREREYYEIYGVTYETKWFKDIENEIVKSDLTLEEGLESLGIIRMRQVLFNINERVNDRYYGWDVTAGIKFPLSEAQNGPTGNPKMTISADYSYPINWNFQLNSSAFIDTPMDSSLFETSNVGIKLDFIYELSNRINFVTNYELKTRNITTDNSELQNFVSLAFWYYLENNIYLVLNAGYTKQGSENKILTSAVSIQYNLF